VSEKLRTLRRGYAIDTQKLHYDFGEIADWGRYV